MLVAELAERLLLSHGELVHHVIVLNWTLLLHLVDLVRDWKLHHIGWHLVQILIR